ncbi:MAG: hypothetical protein U0271_16905 [Polyangiaceae bacterium]
MSVRSSLMLLATGLAMVGCADILGLDEFTDQPKGGGGGSPSTGGSTNGGAGVGGDMGGTGGGGGPPAECTPIADTTDLVDDPDLRFRRAYGAAIGTVAYSAAIAEGPSPKFYVVSMGNGTSPRTQSWSPQNGGIDVFGVVARSTTEIGVLVRANDAIGQLIVPVDSGGVLQIPANAFLAYPTPTECVGPDGYVRNVAPLLPIDPNNPRMAVECSKQDGSMTYLFVGDSNGLTRIDAAAGHPANLRVNRFAKAGDTEVMLLGDDPSQSSYVRLGPDFGAAQLHVESGADRLSIPFSSINNPDGSTKFFLATLAAGSFTPARLFVRDVGVGQAIDLIDDPIPGMTQIAQLETLADLVLLDPVVRLGPSLYSAGVNIEGTSVQLSWMRESGEMLVRNMVVYDMDTPIDGAGALPLATPGVPVLWSEKTGGTTKLRARTVLCVGGG